MSVEGGKREGKARKFYLIIHGNVTMENINNTQSIVKVVVLTKQTLGALNH